MACYWLNLTHRRGAVFIILERRLSLSLNRSTCVVTERNKFLIPQLEVSFGGHGFLRE